MIYRKCLELVVTDLDGLLAGENLALHNVGWWESLQLTSLRMDTAGHMGLNTAFETDCCLSGDRGYSTEVI